MKWYLAKIVFGINADNAPHKAQFEEQLRLVSAESNEEAFLKARIIGLNEEDSFLNSKNNMVKWDFINVADVMELPPLKDGMELCSRIYEIDEARDHVHYVHMKAVNIRLESIRN